MDKKLPFYGEKDISKRRLVKACCASQDAWSNESKSDCCLLSGSLYREKPPIPCCRKQSPVSRGNGTLVCPQESGNPLDEDVVDLP